MRRGLRTCRTKVNYNWTGPNSLIQNILGLARREIIQRMLELSVELELIGSLSGEVVVILARHSFLQHLGSKTHKPTILCTSENSKVGRGDLNPSKRPSQRAYSSAKKLDVMPIFLANPTIQAPSSSQITHPPPTRPEFPSDDPSVFNFTQPRAGLSHLICLITKRQKETPHSKELSIVMWLSLWCNSQLIRSEGFEKRKGHCCWDSQMILDRHNDRTVSKSMNNLFHTTVA
ncbi:hypothetical protein SO802_032454 [Lithocarpus litseifolius]|uniref:Uncharacterized protein n=1 Tax=Lithocarpus litseifolius TaxID=425828 RepID=A0AAW2BAA5_9ROSI